mmetsp:Transcript_84045/g.133223  ORF Transcript_84045/g.133223 Transcript_84045/m.133223 type:complete len:221 (+) Transcript_84045:251-913(+)
MALLMLGDQDVMVLILSLAWRTLLLMSLIAFLESLTKSFVASFAFSASGSFPSFCPLFFPDLPFPVFLLDFDPFFDPFFLDFGVFPLGFFESLPLVFLFFFFFEPLSSSLESSSPSLSSELDDSSSSSPLSLSVVENLSMIRSVSDASSESSTNTRYWYIDGTSGCDLHSVWSSSGSDRFLRMIPSTTASSLSKMGIICLRVNHFLRPDFLFSIVLVTDL